MGGGRGWAFRSDFPCLIDGHCGLTVRPVERCKAICHWSQPVNVIQFYMNSTIWEVGSVFSFNELKTLWIIFMAFQKPSSTIFTQLLKQLHRSGHVRFTSRNDARMGGIQLC